ncbi:uncharacterized protein LOC108469884 isoform X2 [Gossypium arboreum]|nr:uncharacterized protein LOC108469884 isoform X2 [Gossypium arboreum]
MTFCEEVTDQNLDVWANSLASVPDALCHYYYQYLSSSLKAAEGILCIGFLKRSRQQKEITREQAVQDVERIREELEQFFVGEKGYERMWVIKSNGERDIMSLLCASVFSTDSARNTTSRMVQLKDASL